MASLSASSDFPCTLTVRVPFPTQRLAETALRALAVDEELSPLVRRSFSVAGSSPSAEHTVLVTEYRATTNRMLRVAVNGFFESLGVVINVMKELDVDVVNDEWVGDGDEDLDQLKRVQGLEERDTVGAR